LEDLEPNLRPDFGRKLEIEEEFVKAKAILGSEARRVVELVRLIREFYSTFLSVVCCIGFLRQSRVQLSQSEN
jgi:hypothetical protein